ncbi:maltokinase N-terminal cap-like domain-containing protein [Actinoallomurus purpureus]|uniref:maltokinase N-terminal cap-like domain-containing protein n=1 Tax=Actinoallomurus purpureus TaxID=478114 RepID=UPI0027E2E80B|nr:phosphotransferase [Actinoallomurus purpureus]
MRLERLDDLLMDWLPRQRWFAGKDRGINGISVLSDTELVEGDPALHHVVIAVHQDGGTDRYQVPLGVRSELPGRLEYAAIGQLDDETHLYDAVHDPELTRAWLENMAGNVDVGPLAFRSITGIDTELDSFASPAEQSNTSLIYGDAYICKLFRRLTPGINPDLELSLGLVRAGSKHVPELYGWFSSDLDGTLSTLAMMSEFLRSGTDGWQLAGTSVRDLYAEADLRADEVGGDFAGESERLGAATAEVHRDLAGAFGTGEMMPAEVRAVSEQMGARLDETCAAVPQLTPYAGRLTDAFDALAELDAPLVVQRVHGDYHLGQVMRTDSGWMLLDFEGEPAKPLEERRARAHPLRDVAGMLRSFDYAARHLLVNGQVMGGDRDQLEFRAQEWADRNRAAFCRGYAEAGGIDPASHEVVLRAFEFDKAVYEVLYEARNRPSWLPIPLDSIAALSTRPESGYLT